MLYSHLWMVLAVTTKLGCHLRMQPRPPSGHWEFLLYCQRAMTYQRDMTAIFHDMMHKEIEDYVDDIVVKSKVRENYFFDLRRVFERCRLYKLRMNPLMCAFGVPVGKFLGFLVHQRGIDVDPSKAQAISTMKASLESFHTSGGSFLV